MNREGLVWGEGGSVGVALGLFQRDLDHWGITLG